MSSADEPDTTTSSCYRWSRDFAVAHAIFASGLVTFPVSVLLLLNRRHSGCAVFFAAFAAICTTSSLILCLRFYADLTRPPWPRRWASAAVAGDEEETTTTTPAMSSHALRHPEQQLVVHRAAEMHAALAAGRFPSYEYPGPDGDGMAADSEEDCAVCLGELEKGDTVRQLPACHHVFHEECIDPWMRAHATCPVCRCSVLQTPQRPVVEVVWSTSEQFMGRPALSLG